MSGFFKRTYMVLALGVALLCFVGLGRAYRTDSLLGLWDSGRFSSQVMPEPVPIPEEQLVRLVRRHRISFQAKPEEGRNLAEIFQWYDLDTRYVDATVKTDELDPTKFPTDRFDVVLLNEN